MKVDPTQHLWWLASRASGIVALILLTVAVLAGLSLGGKMTQKLPKRMRNFFNLQPKNVSRLHEQLSVAALVAVCAHGVTLLGDAFLHPTISQLVVPFTIAYKPFGTGMGIVAGYIAAALGLSFYARNKIGVKTWRKLHRFTIVAYALAVGHTLTAGTDAMSPWLRTPVLASAGLVTAMFAFRVADGRKKAKGKAESARKPLQPAYTSVTAR